MRILTVGNMYPPHSLGGYELTWRSSVEHLRSTGHEVEVLTTGFRLARKAHVGDPSHVHRDLDWYWHDHEFTPMSPRRRLALERRNAKVLRDRLARLRPQAVGWWAMGGMSLSMIERVRRMAIPAVGVVGDDWMVYGPRVDGWMRAFRGGRLKSVARQAGPATGIPTTLDLGRAARWLFVSEEVRADARAHWDLPATELAHPGIDSGLFAATPPTAWRWKLAYVGRIDPRKGLDSAVRALGRLPAAATLTITGAGDDRHLAELRALAGQLGLGDRVLFQTLPRESIATAYADADVILFPVTWREPWGLVPLEAMAVGRPVITSARGGQRAYVRDGENCLVVDPDAGADALADAIRRLAGGRVLRERLRAGGAETSARFTEAAYNDRIAAALERAAVRWSSPAAAEP